MLKTRLSKLARISLVALTASGCTLAQGTPASKSASQPDSAARARAVDTYGKLPLSFEANQGQTDSRVKFMAQGPGYKLFLTSDAAVLALPAPSRAGKPSADGEHSSAMAMRLVGANLASRISGMEELEGKSNYFIGNDPAKWRTNVPNYAKVRYREVYPGVDLVYYGSQERVEYDFVVAAGSDPRAIRLAFERASRESTGPVYGVAPLRIDGSGDLLAPLNGSEVRLHKPTAYQLTAERGTTDGNARHLIDARYVLRSNGQVGIRLGPYDTTKALVIDPVLTYASRLGGNGELTAAIAVDGAGNVYVSGTAESFNFPVVNQIPGACQGTCSTGFEVVYVTKINAAGNALVYSSLIGGSNLNQGSGIAVDSLGNAYLTGLTNSTDFPQVNPITGACVGTCGTGLGQDAFVTKIDAAGDALVYSSLLGGSSNDDGFAIAVDSSRNAYLTGETSSTDFPQVNPIPGACLGTCGTGSFPQDAFVTEVNAAGNALVYSSYLAGSAFTFGAGIAADSAGNAYVVGLTQSADFPRVNQIAAACVGTCGTGASSDGFVTKITAQGTSLAYSSVFGGSGFNMGSAIAVDSSGNAYLTGSTQSVDFPQVNAIKKACTKGCGNGTGDAFVSKINSAGTALVYSSLLGGERDDEGTGIAVDSLGNAYLIGFTQSVNFPSVRPIRGACLGTCGKKLAANVFVVNVDATGSKLVYSSVIGGSASDQGHGIAVDSSGNAYLTGFTQSADFPIVNQIPGACLGNCGSAFNQDTFVIKVAP
jgi:hypothetical protein